MSTGAGNEIVGRYNINQHIEYILGVLSVPEHETYGLEAALELISFHLPEHFKFNHTHFVTEFSIFLEKVGIIEHSTAGEVYALSARIIALTGRNFRLIELIKAFEIVLRAYEIQTGSLV